MLQWLHTIILGVVRYTGISVYRGSDKKRYVSVCPWKLRTVQKRYTIIKIVYFASIIKIFWVCNDEIYRLINSRCRHRSSFFVSIIAGSKQVMV